MAINIAGGVCGETTKMPGLVMFGRRWSFGSDDLVLPHVVLALLHTAWYVTSRYVTLIYLLTYVNVRFQLGDHQAFYCLWRPHTVA